MRRIAGILWLAGVLLALVPAAAMAAPNVVVVMTDDQTAASMSVMRNTQSLIGAQGTSFSRFFVTYPLCCPSRATYLTGQYSHNHGVVHNAGPYGGYKRLDHSNTLPVWLQRAGYRTISVGRYLNGYGKETSPNAIPPGWSDWYTNVDPTTYNYASWQMNENGLLSNYPAAPFPGEHQTDFLTRRAVEMVKAAAPSPQPFFLSLTYTAPHSGQPRDSDDPQRLGTPSPAPRHRDAFTGTPMPRPPSFNEADVADKPQVISDRPLLNAQQITDIQENWQQELESLLSVDDGVAAVYDALAASGELENTLFVFTSDNGFLHGEHRAAQGKILPYEESIKVPLLMRGPGVPRGRTDRRLVANVDLAPTILDAANALPGRTEDGASLFGLMRDRGREWGRDILLENGYGANGVPAYKGIRTYRYLYVDHRSTGEEELYDLRRDPYELENLAYRPRYDELRLTLARRVRALSRCRGKACRARPKLGLSVKREPPPRRKRGKRRARKGQRGCVSADLRVGVRGGDRRRVARIDLYVGARRVATDRRAPFAKRLRVRRLKPGATNRLRVRAETETGRVLTLDRNLRRC